MFLFNQTENVNQKINRYDTKSPVFLCFFLPMNLLSTEWFLEPPIDFEHKHWILLQYLQDIDLSYARFKLSPYLLNTEKISNSMENFKDKLDFQEHVFKKEIIGFSLREGIQRTTYERPEFLMEIVEIVDYALPLLNSKVQIGYKLLRKYPQILYP